MVEAIHPLLHSSNTPSWRYAQLKAQGQLYLYLYLIYTGAKCNSPSGNDIFVKFLVRKQRLGSTARQDVDGLCGLA